MDTFPLVTVICLCYNHKSFVIEALESVLIYQDYPSIQLIVCDDASTDGSVEAIQKFLHGKEIQFIIHTENKGNCFTFNEALRLAQGKYVIDLAADDKLLPNSLTKRVAHFESVSHKVALTYSNASYINELGNFLFNFNDMVGFGAKLEGDVFQKLFEKKFICPPSVMFKSKELKGINGYDENLSFEDFDVWMRLARDHEFAYCEHLSVAKRLVVNSSSSKFYSNKDNRHLQSTLMICKKAIAMARANEIESIGKFVLYHFRLAYFTGNFDLAKDFWALSEDRSKWNYLNRFFKFLLDKKFNIYFLYRLYIKIRLKDSKLS